MPPQHNLDQLDSLISSEISQLKNVQRQRQDLDLTINTSQQPDPSMRSKSNSSSPISVGNPKSPFVPVNVSDKKTLNTKHVSNISGMKEKWESMEKNNKLAEAMKNKPLEYKFKPILENSDKALKSERANNGVNKKQQKQKTGVDPNPEVQQSNLSSRARRRKNVPFVYIEFDDDDSCTTVSSITDAYAEEYDTFLEYAETLKMNVDANKALIEETNELMKRIEMHHLEMEEEQQHGIDPVLGIKARPADTNKLLVDTANLLNDVSEIALPDDIAALVEEDENLLGKSSSRSRSIMDEMDMLENEVSVQSQVVRKDKSESDNKDGNEQLPPDIAALLDDDNDLSFDDLRVESEDNKKPKKGKYMNLYLTCRDYQYNCISSIHLFIIEERKEETIVAKIENVKVEVVQNQPPEEKSDDEGLSFEMSLHGEDDKREDEDEESFANKKQTIHFEKRDTHDNEDISNMYKPSMLTESNANKKVQIPVYQSKRSLAVQLSSSFEKKDAIPIQKPIQEKRPDSPPLRVIFVPNNFCHDETFSCNKSLDHSFAKSKTSNTLSTAKSSARNSINLVTARIRRSKQDNDARIQNIIKRGRERFLTRLNRVRTTNE